MENWGLVTYRNTALLCDEKRTSVSGKQRVAYVVCHELAHQWFGNLGKPGYGLAGGDDVALGVLVQGPVFCLLTVGRGLLSHPHPLVPAKHCAFVPQSPWSGGQTSG